MNPPQGTAYMWYIVATIAILGLAVLTATLIWG